MTINRSAKVDCIKPTTEVLEVCENKTIPLNAITSGVTADIPVLLATLIVELYVSHLIKLPNEASNIDTIKNKVLLTSCKFLQEANVLFINGFIRKNIYYSSKAHQNLRYYKADIPFECTTTVILNNSKASLILDNNGDNVKHSNENKLLSNDELNFNEESIEFFNKQPFCELISNKITEHYKYLYKNDSNHNMNPFDIKEIIEIDNNMAIMLEIQILQNQHVYINPYCTDRQVTSLEGDKSSANSNTDIINESDSDNRQDLIDTTNLEDKSNPYDKLDTENKSALDSLYNAPNDDDKLNLIDTPNLEDKSNSYDKTDTENKSALDSLYNAPNDDNKLNLIDNPNLEDKSDPYDKTDIKNKSSIDSLYNESNYNDKLDVDYLLDFYNKPDDDNFDLVDNPNLENESESYDNVHTVDEPAFNNLFSLFNLFNRPTNHSTHDLRTMSNLENRSNIYNNNPIDNKLNFISLLSLFNGSNSRGNHNFNDKPNYQNKSNLYNKTPINNKSHFNNYYTRANSSNSYSSYNYRSNTNKLLIFILFIFILYNLNTQNSYR